MWGAKIMIDIRRAAVGGDESQRGRRCGGRLNGGGGYGGGSGGSGLPGDVAAAAGEGELEGWRNKLELGIGLRLYRCMLKKNPYPEAFYFRISVKIQSLSHPSGSGWWSRVVSLVRLGRKMWALVALVVVLSDLGSTGCTVY